MRPVAKSPSSPAERRPLRVAWLGRRPYAPVYDLQVRLREAVARGEGQETLLLLEHEPVITFGRGARPQHLLASDAMLAERGVDVVKTDRGGDITLHAPGQLVAYPIVDLSPDRKDVRRYVNDLAGVMQSLVASYGIESGLVDGLVGLWVDAAAPQAWSGAADALRLAKIGAIGVRLSRWVTLHGFALNLTNPLELFQLIVPCGIGQYGVTSVQQLTGQAPPVADVAAQAARLFADRFGRESGPMEDRSQGPLDLAEH